MTAGSPTVKQTLFRKLPGYATTLLSEMLCAFEYCRNRNLYTYHTIYIAACPNTDSSWLAHLLADILPGFSFYFPRGQAIGQHGNNYDVTDAVVKSLKWKLTTTRSHTPATPDNIATMNRAFGRYLVLTRAIRDVIVSTYHHIRRYPKSAFVDYDRERVLPWRPIPAETLRLDMERCLDVLIERVLPGLVELSQNWVTYQNDHDNVLLLRYEDLTRNTSHEIRRILNFYDMEVPATMIDTSIERLRRELYQDRRLHFRQGKINNWKNELTPLQQIHVEEIARPFLNQMSYQLAH